MEQNLIQKKIAEMVKRIRAQFDPEKVVLFGSHARGTANHDSDVDLLVIKKNIGSKRRIRLEIRQALHGIGISKDIVVATPEEVNKYQNVVGTIIRPALRDGIVLYDKTSNPNE